MAVCSRCERRYVRIDKSTGLCSSCTEKDTQIYNTLLSSGRKVCFFRNGYLYDLIPRNLSLSLYEDRQTAYDIDSVIVSDGDIYDPETPASLARLRIPHFIPREGIQDTTSDLSYILKMRCEKLSDRKHASLFVQTTLYMMDASPIGWSRGDYLRVILTFHSLGMIHEGNEFESIYRRNNPELFSSPLCESDEGKHLLLKYYYETKGYRHHEYDELKRLVHDLVPDTYKGYAQIKGRNTKRYQLLVKEAESLGYVFIHDLDRHHCTKYNEYVKMETKYDTSGKSPRLLYCECPIHYSGKCTGRDENGLLCIYPSTGKKKVY